MNAPGQEPQPIAEWAPEAVAIVRPGMLVETHLLPPGMAAFLAALVAGGTLGAAADAAFSASAAFDLQGAFSLLLAAGFFFTDSAAARPGAARITH